MNLESQNDKELLRLFVSTRNEQAFEHLVRRHGDLVASVARRKGLNPTDADDVVQAVFIVLAHKAPGLCKRESIAGWLHHTTVNVISRLRTSARRRNTHEQEAASMNPREQDSETHAAWQALRPVLDQHLDQLPENYRQALVLHHLQGETLEGAAVKMAVPVGTFAAWVSRGRELLRKKLTRSDVHFSAGMLGSALSYDSSLSMSVTQKLSSEVISRMAQTAARAVVHPATAHPSPQAAALSKKELTAMMMNTVTKAAAVVVLLAGTAGGVFAALSGNPALENKPALALVDKADGPQPKPVAQTSEISVAQVSQKQLTPEAEPRDDKKPEVTKPAGEPDVAALIKQLGDADLAIRIEATNKLKAFGEKATAALQAAVKSSDHDVSSRATLILAVLKTQPLVEKIKAAPTLPKTLSFTFKVTANLGKVDVVNGKIDEIIQDMPEEQKSCITGTLQCYSDWSKFAFEFALAFNTGLKPSPVPYINITAGRESNFAAVDVFTAPKIYYKKNTEYARKPSGPQEVTSGLCNLFDFTKVEEKTINGEALYELTGVLREDFLSPLQIESILRTSGASFMDSLKTLRHIVLRVDKNDMLIRSGEISNDNDQVLASLVVSDVQINPVFDDKIFGAPMDSSVMAMSALKAFCEAEEIHHCTDYDHDGVLEYAQHLKGNDSLHETAAGKSDLCLIDKTFADAEGEPGSGAKPRDGYCFKMLTKQGKDAAGGVRDYVIKGNMVLGYAMIAYPAEYKAGLKCFMINNLGTIYAKDLGKDTLDIVKKMTEFNPDKTWSVVE